MISQTGFELQFITSVLRMVQAVGASPKSLREQERGRTAYRPATAEPNVQRIDSRTFRRAMGQFATGVTVITTDGPHGPHGMTANAVTSVSLDPPQILVCVARSARLARYLTSGSRFAINILGEEQEPLSRYFARAWPRTEQPPSYQFAHAKDTVVLSGSITSVICEVADRYQAGDHEIILGTVRTTIGENGDRKPLLFFRGDYTCLS